MWHIYHGVRDESGIAHVYLDGEVMPVNHSLRIRNHSPTGFEWGYGGSGPAQLALAILLVETTEIEALGLHQGFKRDVIARCPGMGFAFTSIDVKEWLDGRRGTELLIEAARAELEAKNKEPHR